VEERDYRARLPGAKEWREAQARLAAAVAEERQPEGAPGDDAGDGSGSGGEEERRSSPIVELSLLLAECVQHGLRTIAFCNTRWAAAQHADFLPP
jgi:DEAD/DEAH box helicase domain-containing protein